MQLVIHPQRARSYGRSHGVDAGAQANEQRREEVAALARQLQPGVVGHAKLKSLMAQATMRALAL